MKKFLGCLALILIATFSAYSQTHFDSRVDIGVRGGVTFSEVMFKPSIIQKFGLGKTAGITFRYSEENHFGLIAEVNFVQRGWAEKFENLPFKYHRILDYIEVPVMSHIYFGRRGKFFFNAGPEVAFYLGDKTISNFDYENPVSVEGFDSSNRRTEQLTLRPSQKIDFGIIAGVGGEFSINPRNAISVEARIYYGIGNVMPSGRQDTFSVSNQLSFCVTAGYWFRIK